MQPVQVQVTGTAKSTTFFPDIYQNPFQVGIGVAVQTGTGGTAFLSVEHTLDWQTVYHPSFNGATALVNGAVQTATWFPNSGIGGTASASGTTVSTTGMNSNYAFAVAAIRVNVFSAVATTIVVANFLQSVNSP